MVKNKDLLDYTIVTRGAAGFELGQPVTLHNDESQHTSTLRRPICKCRGQKGNLWHGKARICVSVSHQENANLHPASLGHPQTHDLPLQKTLLGVVFG